MQTYCVSSKGNTGNKNAKIIKKKNGRLQMRSTCSVCGKKNHSLYVNKKVLVYYQVWVLEHN